MTIPVESLSHVALLTKDRSRAVAFYRDFLGFKVIYETEHSAMLRQEGTDWKSCGIVLFEPDGGALPSGAGRVSHLGFRLPSRREVDSCARAARREGHAVTGPVQDDYIGYYCLVQDPDGNQLEFSAPEGVNRF